MVHISPNPHSIKKLISYPISANSTMSQSLVKVEDQGGSAAGDGGGKAAKAASSSTENTNSVAISERSMQCYLYPASIAQYEDVIASPLLFMDILGKFHAAMGTKFKIPIVGGRDLDLHRLFMEVTSRGGIKKVHLHEMLLRDPSFKVLEEKKWREVANSFSFPPSATNASFILRKYYMSLLHHFEQVYYFKAKAWTPVPTDTWQTTKTTLTSTSEFQDTCVKKQRMSTEDLSLAGGSPIGLPVTGVLDGKFESGYLCTVRIGGEQLQGVLYQTTQSSLFEIPRLEGQVTMDSVQGLSMVRCRRRRRKKSEIRKRDPAQPKPNRSGYNFFFAEQHARLRSLHRGKDRAISSMVGEEWNKLTESEKAVYQEKAAKDKERYRSEMENYRESFKKGQVSTASMSLQQPYFMMDTNTENNGENSHKSHEYEPNSEYSDDHDDSSSFEGEEETTSKEPGAENVELEHKKSFNIEDDHVMFLDESGQQKSMSGMNH